MTKEAIIKGLKKVSGSDKEKSRLFAEVIRDIIVEGLTEEGIVKIKGLGTFKVIEVKARKSVDVNTGAEIEIAAHKKVTFTAENQLADEVNEPLSHLDVVNLGANGEAVSVVEKKVKEKKVKVKEETVAEEKETTKGKGKKAAAAKEKATTKGKTAAAKKATADSKKEAEDRKKTTDKKGSAAVKRVAVGKSDTAGKSDVVVDKDAVAGKVAEGAKAAAVAAEKMKAEQAKAVLVAAAERMRIAAEKEAEKEAVKAAERKRVAEEKAAEKVKDDEAMRRLGEDAESLKGILAMINGTVEPVNPEEQPVVNYEPVKPVEQPVVSYEPVKPVEQPVVSYEPVKPVEQPVVSYEPVKPVEQPVVSYEPVKPVGPQPIDLGPAPKGRGKLWMFITIVISVLVLGGGVAWFILRSERGGFEGKKTVKEGEKIEMSAEEKEKARKEELERIKAEAKAMGSEDDDDSTYVYTGVKKPESKEPIVDANTLAIVRVKDGDRLMSLSKQYYGHKMFWVYIYKANIKSLRSPNDLQIGMQLVIPRLDPKLTDIENVESMEKVAEMEAKYLGQ